MQQESTSFKIRRLNMLRKALVVAALCLLPAIANGQVRGPWEVMVAANGVNGNKFNGFAAGANASLGFFFNDNIEVAVRQSLTYSDIGPLSLNASTRLAADFHIPLGDQNQFLPYAGANIGYVYGKGVRDTWEAAPEIGLKWFVGPDVFVAIQAEYQFFFRNGGQANNAFRNGQFVYTLGVGFRV
jgi:outer membrane protein W